MKTDQRDHRDESFVWGASLPPGLEYSPQALKEDLFFFFSSQLSSFAAPNAKVTSAGFKREGGFYSSAHVLGSPKTGESLELFASRGCSLLHIRCCASILCHISTEIVGSSPPPPKICNEGPKSI